jgi:beta-glucosidase
LTDGGRRRFPDGFLWGAATSSYQIEGAVDEDGRGPSIWDTQCRTPGRVANGDTGDIATDHYHRYREDIALMRSLGLQGYRFSVAWPRIQPTGEGAVNQAGLDFYSRLVDELLSAGIRPFLTLYHWDLPQALQDKGGWPSRDTAFRFAEYAAIVFETLRDRVDTWATLNEPWCSSMQGYVSGTHAPGHSDPVEGTRAIHHLNLGHGLAVRAMRDIDAAPRHGIVLNLVRILPSGPDPDGVVEEGRRRSLGLRDRAWTEPLLRGRYPEDVVRDLEAYGGLPVEPGDLEIVAQPLDWLGLNYYNDVYYQLSPGARVRDMPGTVDVASPDPGPDATDMGWPITPDGLRALMVEMRDEYPDLPPLYVTENGAAFDDPMVDGAIHDERRIAYLDAHLRALRAAISEGVDVRGYFQWSLLDNFEWSHGYAKRFGIVHVDFETQVRTPRDSAWWYRDVIAENGIAENGIADRDGGTAPES